jgi:hypothetical protein
MGERSFRFVVRACHDRVARKGEEESWSKVKTIAEQASGVLTREVPLSRKPALSAPNARAKNPPRKMRMATLQVSAQKVTLCTPHYLKSHPELELNLVRVFEPRPPAGEKSVEWMLYTTEPVDTPEQIAHVVDIYRSRWLIEEFFKALKTGCAYEQREFESFEALRTLLALTLPIACELLWLRSRSREAPKAPATEVLSATQLQVLRLQPSSRLPVKPTAVDALMAVARLGGHLKRNGPPGWQVLYRGMQQLLSLEAGWNAAMRHMAKSSRRDVINR